MMPIDLWRIRYAASKFTDPHPSSFHDTRATNSTGVFYRSGEESKCLNMHSGMMPTLWRMFTTASSFWRESHPIYAVFKPETGYICRHLSKTLMPALRIGYMVLPAALCAQMREAKICRRLAFPHPGTAGIGTIHRNGNLWAPCEEDAKALFKKAKPFNWLFWTIGLAGMWRFPVLRRDCISQRPFAVFVLPRSRMKKLKTAGLQISAMRKHLPCPMTQPRPMITRLSLATEIQKSKIWKRGRNFYRLL